MPIGPKRRRSWYAGRELRRASSSERGYDSRWREYSEQYRRLHPLCVPCLMRGSVRPSRCVDHIVPIHSCPALAWEVENHCAMCFVDHGMKTRQEPQHEWEPIEGRIVVCGLRGTGKSTWANATGWPVWDTDEHEELTTIDEVKEAREQWIARQHRECVVIVASIITASQLAARIQGSVKHMTTRYVEREPHPIWSRA